MLDIAEIDQVVTMAASSALKKAGGIREASSRPTIDSYGEEALNVTIVLKGNGTGVQGEDAVRALVKIDQALQQRGERRFPILSFVTEEELTSRADTND